MTAMMVCSQCHQPVRHARAGVFLGPVKLMIFDMLKAAGDIGMSSEEIAHQLANLGARANYHTIKAHIFQLREQLAGSDYRIARDTAKAPRSPQSWIGLGERVPSAQREPARYLLVRRRKAEAAE